ncbi:MAG: hypothetical protein ABGY95_12090 [Rubritalea sp.]|uniref:hypothetical protein n=1 Tax=Rubritalea sp. TaxID=2109375 RepID=UPI003242591E
MNSYFEQLGRTVQERWQQNNFSLESFPEIAQAALEEAPPARNVDLGELIREFLINDEQPLQGMSGFGQPELVAFSHPRFYIQILFWLDGTTDIHQHAFSGAFHVMSGSSIHTEYNFEEAHSVTPHLRLGDLSMKQIELLKAGRTVPISSGRGCIHSLFHLDSPSVTVVVRTQNDPDAGAQFNYLPPHVAIDPNSADTLTMRRNQLLYVLETLGHSAYALLVREMITKLDFERGFFILRDSMGCLQELGEWDAILDTFEQKHGELADGIAVTLAEGGRRETIASMRGQIEDPDLRFFLALLINVSARADILGLISARFPDHSPTETILGWAEELLFPINSGLALLDAPFPLTLEATIDEQADALMHTLQYALEENPNGASVPEEISEIYTSLAQSSLSVLFT